MTAKLNKLGEAMQNTIMENVLLELADDIAVTAKSLVPVESGALRDSIDTWAKRDGSITETFTGTTKAKLRGSMRDAMFKGKTFYGGFWEFGHYLGKRRGGRRIGTKYVIDPKNERRTVRRRRQFLAPAFDRHLEPWLSRLPTRLQEEIDHYMGAL